VVSQVEHKRSRITQRTRTTAVFYFCISPWLIGLLTFTVGAMVASLALSFTRYDIVTPSVFVGLDNYARMFMRDELIPLSLKVTSIYSAVSVPLGMIVALFLAMVLNQKIPGVTLFRTIFYTPSIITGVPVALLWWILLRPTGAINSVLAILGIRGPSWLFDTDWVLPAFILMSLWSIGGGIVINLAALQGVPQELYEAAEIDGAGRFQRFWRVTVPVISPVILFNLVMGIIGSFQAFVTSYVMTNGGPNNASLFFALHLYRHAFKYFNMGYASALAWLLFAIILALTLSIVKSSPAWVYYESMAGAE